MRCIGSIGVASLMALVGSHLSVAECTEPGKARWGTKSNVPLHSSVANATLVSLADLMKMPDPDVKKNQPKTGLIPEFDNPHHLKEGQVVRTRGWFRLVATEDNDCEYHMQLTLSKSSKASFIVEVAKDDATSIHSQWVRDQAKSVREWVRTNVTNGNEPSDDSLKTPIYVEVAGQLFFDSAHGPHDKRGKKGMPAATRWEIHPVLAIKTAKPPK